MRLVSFLRRRLEDGDMYAMLREKGVAPEKNDINQEVLFGRFSVAKLSDATDNVKIVKQFSIFLIGCFRTDFL